MQIGTTDIPAPAAAPTARVVILNWNGEAMLQRFLPKVVRTLPPWADVVVADNGSTDHSCVWVEENHPEVTLLRLDRNYGYAGGYNRALEGLAGEYFILLNSDVEPAEGWIEALVSSLRRHPDTVAAAPKLRSLLEPDRFEYAGASGGFIDALGYPFCRGRILNRIERDRGQYDDEREVFWVSGAAFCCRAEAFRQAGGFDADFFAHMEEIDLCWRWQLAGWRVRIVPQSLVYHVGGGTLTIDSPQKVYLNHRNNLMMLCKCASAPQRLAVIVLRPLLDAMAALSYLGQGRGRAFRAVFRAWYDFLRSHRQLLAKRRAVQALGNGTRQLLPGLYRGSILLRYLFGLKQFGKML